MCEVTFTSYAYQKKHQKKKKKKKKKKKTATINSSIE